MYLPITGTLNMKCQPFLHFLPQISDVQRMSNCLHSQTGEKKKKNHWTKLNMNILTPLPFVQVMLFL